MAQPSPSTRIWYQSFVHPIEHKPYIERLQAYLDMAASPGVTFEVPATASIRPTGIFIR